MEIRVGLVNELRMMLERAQIDLVVGPHDLTDSVAESEFLPLVDDRVGILCRSDHALLENEQIRATDLEACSWVAHSRGSMLRSQTESALIAIGLNEIRVSIETDSIHSVLEIVASTDLITTMPRVTAQPYLTPDLCFAEFDHDHFHRPIGIIRRKSEARNSLVEAFIQLLLN